MGNCLNLPKEQQPPPISVEAENVDLRVFTFKELKKATRKFKHNIVVKRKNGSTQTFYKGYLNETTFAPSRNGTGIAVSVMECSSEAIQELKEEVKSIGKFSHPNLVKCLGYCCEDNKSFFVFEYMHNGNLDCHIFGRNVALPWEMRIKIAIGIAQGFSFLHSMRESPLHQKLRTHNIMLDEQYNAKLFYLESDDEYFKGAARIMRNLRYIAPEAQIMGELQYIAPECEMGERGWGMENNVYTFGVILLELLTGLKVGAKNLKRQSLGFWNRYFFPGNYDIVRIVDPRLGNNYPVDAATQMITLIRRCTKPNMKKRPSMQEVLDVLSYIAEIKY